MDYLMLIILNSSGLTGLLVSLLSMCGGTKSLAGVGCGEPNLMRGLDRLGLCHSGAITADLRVTTHCIRTAVVTFTHERQTLRDLSGGKEVIYRFCAPSPLIYFLDMICCISLSTTKVPATRDLILRVFVPTRFFLWFPFPS
jgi:hypothetical protein